MRSQENVAGLYRSPASIAVTLPDAIARHEILAGDRPFVTTCLLCLAPALELMLTRKGNYRLACDSCRVNGFVKSAGFLRAWVGAGEPLRGQAPERLSVLHRMLVQRGTAYLGGASWETGEYGGTTRPVLNRALLCVSCGSVGAALREDSRGKPYLACAGGCTAILFIPLPGQVPLLAGWTALQHEQGLATWAAWVATGSDVWARWQGLGDDTAWTGNEAGKPAEEDAWTGSINSLEGPPSSRSANSEETAPSPPVPILSKR